LGVTGIFPIHHNEAVSDEWKLNKKFWEELVAYFPFITMGVSAMTSIKTLISALNEVNKTIL
jgi:hypothetical protein